MSTAGKVFLSAAFGAFIGSALAVWYGWSLWLGMLAGGFVGYMSYNFSEVRRAVPVAFHRAVAALDVIKWKRVWNHLAMGIMEMMTVLFWLTLIASCLFAGIAYGVMIGTAITTPEYYIGWWWVGVVVAGLIGIACVVLFFKRLEEWMNYGPWELSREAEGRRLLKVMIIIFPLTCLIGVPLWAITRVPSIVRWWSSRGRKLTATAVTMILGVFPAAVIFLWHLFKLIHSDLRLLCGVDAVFGVIVGWKFGNPLLGAIVGGVLGVINYQLVSIRWLKLVPASKKM